MNPKCAHRLIGQLAGVVLAVGLAGCGPQMPAHVIEVWSNCSGEEQLGHYRFPDHTFEAAVCSGDWLTGSCSYPGHPDGEWVGGDEVVTSIRMEGAPDYGHGYLFYTYRFCIETPEETEDGRTLSCCRVYRDESDDSWSGKKFDCYGANRCQAFATLANG